MPLIKCESKHTAEVTALYFKVVDFLENSVNYPKWSGSHPSRESIKEYIKNGIQYAYAEDGRMLGAVVLSEDPEGNYDAGEWKCNITEGEYLVIHVLGVDPEISRSGIGSSIVQACIEYARDNNYKAIRLDAVPDNVPAIRLYEKMGFHYAGTKDLKRNIKEIPEFALYELVL